MEHSDAVMKSRSFALVIAMIGKDSAPRWWSSPNKAFDGKTPAEMDIKTVYDYLMDYANK